MAWGIFALGLCQLRYWRLGSQPLFERWRGSVGEWGIGSGAYIVI